VNQRPVETRDVAVPGDGIVAVGFNPVAIPPGNARGEVRLEPVDSLALDDTYRFVASGERPLRVLVIQQSGATPFSPALGISRGAGGAHRVLARARISLRPTWSSG
jgi:hypothetical protein